MNTQPRDTKPHTGKSNEGVRLVPIVPSNLSEKKKYKKKSAQAQALEPEPVSAQEPSSEIEPQAPTPAPAQELAPELPLPEPAPAPLAPAQSQSQIQQPENIQSDLSDEKDEYTQAKEKINALTDATPENLTQLINDITPLITINGNIPLKITYSNPSIPPPAENAPKYYIYDSTSKGTRNNDILKKNFMNSDESLYQTFMNKLVSLINNNNLTKDNYNNTNEINKIKDILTPQNITGYNQEAINRKKNSLEEKITQAFEQNKPKQSRKTLLNNDSPNESQSFPSKLSDDNLKGTAVESSKSLQTSTPPSDPQVNIAQRTNQKDSLQPFPRPPPQDLPSKEMPQIQSSRPPQELSSNNIISNDIANKIKGTIDAVQIGVQQSSQQLSSQQPPSEPGQEQEQGQGQGAQTQLRGSEQVPEQGQGGQGAQGAQGQGQGAQGQGLVSGQIQTQPQGKGQGPEQGEQEQAPNNTSIQKSIVDSIEKTTEATNDALQNQSSSETSQKDMTPEQTLSEESQLNSDNTSIKKSIQGSIKKTTEATNDALQGISNQSSYESSKNNNQQIPPSEQESSQPPQNEIILAGNIATMIQQIIQSINDSLKQPSREDLKEDNDIDEFNEKYDGHIDENNIKYISIKYDVNNKQITPNPPQIIDTNNYEVSFKFDFTDSNDMVQRKTNKKIGRNTLIEMAKNNIKNNNFSILFYFKLIYDNNNNLLRKEFSGINIINKYDNNNTNN